MKLNKFKTLVPAAVALFLATGMTSCMDDLKDGNIDPTVEASPAFDGLYAKCYAGLIMEGNDGNADFTISDAGKSTLLRNIYNFNELSTDESICWWSDGGITDIGYNQCEASTATLKFLYYRLMSNITYCNEFIENFGEAGDKAKIAEVRFIRAYNVYQLLDFFGDPSFTDKIISTNPLQAHEQNSNYDPGKTYTRHELLMLGREFLFKWIEKELLTAEADMLVPGPKKDTDANYGRADKAAAWLMLSRLYLNAGTYLNDDGQNNPYWENAYKYSKMVIEDSNYHLFTEKDMSAEAKANGYKPYDLLFMGDNGSNGASCEAILPLLQDGIKTQGWGGSLFFIASLWNDKMSTVTGLGAGTTGNNWSGMRCRPQLIEKFTSNPASWVGKTTMDIRALNIDDRALFWGQGSGNDKRTLELVDADGKINAGFYTGLATTKWNNNYSTGGTPHDSYNVDIDYFLLRVAEAYLNGAEAALHLGYDGDAKNWINELRNRANAETQQSYDLNFVLDERAREMYCEGLRRPDLIRYNQFGGPQATYTWSLKGSSTSLEGVNFEKYRNVYPIPQSEIDANQKLIQIDGYSTTAE